VRSFFGSSIVAAKDGLFSSGSALAPAWGKPAARVARDALLPLLQGALSPAEVAALERANRARLGPAGLSRWKLVYQLAVAFVLLLLIAILNGQVGHFTLTPRAVASVLFQGVVVVVFAGAQRGDSTLQRPRSRHGLHSHGSSGH
jgi:hypothetical protein